jgi:hypothetical protein
VYARLSTSSCAMAVFVLRGFGTAQGREMLSDRRLPKFRDDAEALESCDLAEALGRGCGRDA